jgi:uncharacterized membrane protein YqhA
MRPFERIIGSVLWSSRHLALVAVLASLFGALVMFVVSAVDAVGIFSAAWHYVTSDPSTHHALRGKIVASIAEFVDGFLFAAVLIIFALGLYELFIGKIAEAENSELAQRLLLIRSLDDLKARLGNVIFLILIVRYFEYALEQSIETAYDLLALAVGIALIALGLFLTKSAHAKD